MHLLLSWQISGNGSANIPARYVTGYLGDINHVYSGAGDFSAWYEVFLDGNWWTTWTLATMNPAIVAC
jgi:hypothetical protein